MRRIDSEIDGNIADSFVGSGDSIRLGLDLCAHGGKVRQDDAFVVQELSILSRTLDKLGR